MLPADYHKYHFGCQENLNETGGDRNCMKREFHLQF